MFWYRNATALDKIIYFFVILMKLYFVLEILFSITFYTETDLAHSNTTRLKI